MKFSFSLPKKKNILLYSKKPSYNELKRVLDNIKNCSQTNWEKKYFSSIKDQLYYDKDNKKLKELVFNLLKNSN